MLFEIIGYVTVYLFVGWIFYYPIEKSTVRAYGARMKGFGLVDLAIWPMMLLTTIVAIWFDGFFNIFSHEEKDD